MKLVFDIEAKMTSPKRNYQEENVTSKLIKVMLCGNKLICRLINFVENNFKHEIMGKNGFGYESDKFDTFIEYFEAENNIDPQLPMLKNRNCDFLKLSPTMSKFASLQINEEVDCGKLNVSDCIQLLHIARVHNFRKVFEIVITCLCIEHWKVMKDEYVLNVLKSYFPLASAHIILMMVIDHSRPLRERFDHRLSYENAPKSVQFGFQQCQITCSNLERKFEKNSFDKCGLLTLHCDKCEFFICRSCGMPSKNEIVYGKEIISFGREICSICKRSLHLCECAKKECEICSICGQNREQCQCNSITVDDETWQDFVTAEDE